MRRIFINIPNNHVQIDDFICTLDEFTKIERTFILSAIPKKVAEIRCSENSNEPQYEKDMDDNISRISPDLQKRLLGYIAKTKNYKSALERLRKPTPPDLDEIKRSKIGEIEARRKELQYENITYNDMTFFGTENARDNLFKAAMILKGLGVTTLDWLDINNKPVTLSLDDANTIISMLMQRDNTLYLKESRLKLKVNACTSAEELLKSSFDLQ